jgi:AraC-like DNA-binding protein
MLIGAGVAAWPPVLAIWGPGGRSAPHAHHAMHVLLAREGELRVGRRRAAGILTAPDVAHAIDARGMDTLLVFVEPESDVGEKLESVVREAGGTRYFAPRERDELLRFEPPAMIAHLHGAKIPPKKMHPRVRRVLKHLDGAEDTSLAALATVAGLSESRLVHAFTESTGISLRAFLLWKKVQRATAAMRTERSLAMVAQIAGFSDAAHMTRTFVRTFGTTPSELRRTMRPS